MKIKEVLFPPNQEQSIDEHDPFFYDERERIVWNAINALNEIIDGDHIPDYEWRIKEVINCLKEKI